MAFRALVTEKSADGEISSSVQMIGETQLPEGEVIVSVEWAGFNYKDALCLTGKGGLVRHYPHVGGIDFAGRVVESHDHRYHPGQAVILTGWRVGETHWGGFAERARVKADWLVPMPKKFSAREAMCLGTAGLTAMMAINRLKADGLTPASGDVLVTGAGGGVGSIAVYLLSRLGHRVVAVSGRPELAQHLIRLGAQEVLTRDEFAGPDKKALESARWAGVIDPVGGPMLGRILKQVAYDGAVALVGNAGGINWEGSVIPFILRGITLYGIDSVMQPYAARVSGWDRLADLFDSVVYSGMVKEIGLDALPWAADEILNGRIKGRVIV
ncbi:MAG TPA: acryloyl-CoA reductase, partial [Devosiaceae bacterium]